MLSSHSFGKLSKSDVFSVGEAVLVGQLGPKVTAKWVQGIIVEKVSA